MANSGWIVGVLSGAALVALIWLAVRALRWFHAWRDRTVKFPGGKTKVDVLHEPKDRRR
jgi:hypothetical protein